MSVRPKDVTVGDSIIFKAITRHHYRKAKRKVKGFDHMGRPMVGYHGYSDFIVAWSEVLEVEKTQ